MVDLDDIQPDQLQTKGSTIYKALGLPLCQLQGGGQWVLPRHVGH